MSRASITDQGEEPKSSGDRKSQGSIRATDLNYGAGDEVSHAVANLMAGPCSSGTMRIVIRQDGRIVTDAGL
jgi:hypothetical protein